MSERTRLARNLALTKRISSGQRLRIALPCINLVLAFLCRSNGSGRTVKHPGVS